MKQKKNIDRLFQEKFKNFEAHPSDQVWQNIVAAKKEKEDRKLIPIWWRLGGIAALLLLLITIGNAFWNGTSDTTPELVLSDQKENTETSTDQTSPKELNSNITKSTASELVTDSSAFEKDSPTAAQPDKTKEDHILSGVSDTQGAVANQDRVTTPSQRTNKESKRQRYIDDTKTATVSNTEATIVQKETDNSPSSQKQSDLIDPTVTIDKGVDDTTVAVSEKETTTVSENTDTDKRVQKNRLLMKQHVL